MSGSDQETPPAPAPTLVLCPGCGKAFTCDPGGKCWCAALPPVAPRPDEAATCFCPDCLAERVHRAEHKT
jgi:hypothetical protein